MADELVELCLPIYRDISLDDDDKFEKSEALVRESSTLKGDALNDMIMRVCHQCRETAEAEKSSRAQPLAPSRPAIVAQTAESSKPNPLNTTAAPALASTSGPRRFTFNPHASAFTPPAPSFPVPAPIPAGVQRANYDWRREQVNQTITRLDVRIKQLSDGIKSDDARMKEFERQAHENVTRVYGSSPPMDARTGDGRKLMLHADWAENQAQQLKAGLAKKRQEWVRLRTERDERYMDLFPGEGEMGPMG
ncbi:MAG: hypothetical protein Q9201_003485 [Fulgogasparrea decipioides]